MVSGQALVSILQVGLLIAVLGFGLMAVVFYTGVGVPTPDEYNRTTVTFQSPDGTDRGTLSVRIADTFYKQYIGLSHTSTLDPDEGMLFPYRTNRTRTFAMRGMTQPIDIIFVGDDHEVTHIVSAEAPDSIIERHLLYDRYRGQAQWVVEAPSGWAAAHNLSVGDTLVRYPPSETQSS